VGESLRHVGCQAGEQTLGTSLPYTTAMQAWGPRPMPSPTSALSLDVDTAKGTLEPQTVTCGVALGEARREPAALGPYPAKSWERHVRSGMAKQRMMAPCLGAVCALGPDDPVFCSNLLAVANHPGSLLAKTAHHSLPIFASPPPPASNSLYCVQGPAGPSISDPACPLPSTPLCSAHP